MKQFIYSIIGLLLICSIAGCKKAPYESPVSLTLHPEFVSGKSGQQIQSKLYITSPNGVQPISIYKTINLVKDAQFGDVKVAPQHVSGNNYVLDFSYNLRPEEVEKLVGFNFHVVDNNQNYNEKDLTVNTVMSGWQTVFSRKWKLISRLWTSINPSVEDLKDCEKDDIYSFNRDGSYGVNFGKSACTYDGFNVFDNWTLSEDEKTFTTKYHSLFDPSNITTEVYSVTSITSEKIVMQQTVDLSIFGLSDKEVFVYTFEAIP